MGLFVNLGSYLTTSNGGTEKPLFFKEGLKVAEEFESSNNHDARRSGSEEEKIVGRTWRCYNIINEVDNNLIKCLC